MERLITIFTPTYNRAYTLPKLYESLKTQTNQNFDWVIVDDGSTDDTEVLIKSFIDEEIIKITYVRQKNQGKHIAINTGVALAKGDFFIVIDSDDYLLENCIETCYALIERVKEENIAGFTFIRFTEDIQYDTTKYNNKMWFYDEEGEFHWEHWGEMAFCYKTEIAQKYAFPQFEGEKFCPESLVHRRIGKRYRVLYTNYVLASGNYL